MIDDTMTPGWQPRTPGRLDKPDELTTRNRRGAIYDARITAADAERLDKPDESTAPNRRGAIYDTRMTTADAERPFMNSPKTDVNIRPAAYDRPHCHHAHAPPA